MRRFWATTRSSATGNVRKRCVPPRCHGGAHAASTSFSVKLLVDDSLAGRVTALLTNVGHDAIHVGDRELMDAPDEMVWPPDSERTA